MTKQIKYSTGRGPIQLFKEYKPAIFFLTRFLGIYIVGNVLYGLWILSYGNLADPFTLFVTENAAFILERFGYNATTFPWIEFPSVALLIDGYVVVNVYEGCNAINVSILFVAFTVAYKGTIKRTLGFSFVGLVLIYIFNLIRVTGLFLVANYFPDQLYLMHKFVFTGVIYSFVFVLWFIWVKKFVK